MSAENPRGKGSAESSTDADDKDSSVKCPTCGRDDFASKKGMRWHHSVKHDESIAGELVECEWCGEEFRDTYYRHEDVDNPTCSNECKGKVLSENYSGEDHWSWKEKIERECSSCGDIVHLSPYRANKSEHVYCDFDCLRGSSKHVYSGEEHPRWKDSIHITTNCDVCGDEIQTVSYKPRRVCSEICKRKSVSEKMSGQDNPRWGGGYKEYYGPNWYSQRRKARKRDQYSCCVCGKDERQLGRIPDCHHINKIRHYRQNYDAPEWYERGNRTENLMLLCEDHHSEWEGIPLRPQ